MIMVTAMFGEEIEFVSLLKYKTDFRVFIDLETSEVVLKDRLYIIVNGCANIVACKERN